MKPRSLGTALLLLGSALGAASPQPVELELVASHDPIHGGNRVVRRAVADGDGYLLTTTTEPNPRDRSSGEMKDPRPEPIVETRLVTAARIETFVAETASARDGCLATPEETPGLHPSRYRFRLRRGGEPFVVEWWAEAGRHASEPCRNLAEAVEALFAAGERASGNDR